ncbi:sugar phosphate isomerase/epimerase family protein [Paenibacillus pasadenensis]|uniref:sugar phosphate isomerase/epimerase family protein n=1 Tax=Paenibacillus TaxID=44249 RepID=UPI000403690C|nr:MULTISPECIES: sugar phosphate isomerase/epimerase family protein [Paenibacillus]
MLERGGIALSGIGDEASSSLEEQARVHAELGWTELELRSADGAAFADWDDALTGKARRLLSGAGLKASIADSRIGNWERTISTPYERELEELERCAERLLRLGGWGLRVMSWPNDGLSESDWEKSVLERMDRLAEQAGRCGVTLLHENCAGWAGCDPERALRLVETVGRPSLRLLVDTGNGIAYRYSAPDYLRRALPYVEHVHVKDGRLENGKAMYTLPGRGDAGVAECLGLLLDAGYTGLLAIEPHLHVVPHLGERGGGAGQLEAYAAYGRELERLLAAVRADARSEAAAAGEEPA